MKKKKEKGKEKENKMSPRKNQKERGREEEWKKSVKKTKKKEYEEGRSLVGTEMCKRKSRQTKDDERQRHEALKHRRTQERAHKHKLRQTEGGEDTLHEQATASDDTTPALH